MCCTGLWTETVNKLSDALFSESSQNVLINQWMGSFQYLTLEALSNSIVFTEREVPGFAAALLCFSAPLAHAFLAVFSLSLSGYGTYQLPSPNNIFLLSLTFWWSIFWSFCHPKYIRTCFFKWSNEIVYRTSDIV